MTDEDLRRIRYNTVIACVVRDAMAEWRDAALQGIIETEQFYRLRQLCEYAERYRREREWQPCA